MQNRITELIGTSNILTKVSTTLEKTVADAKLAEVTAKTELDKRAAELEKRTSRSTNWRPSATTSPKRCSP